MRVYAARLVSSTLFVVDQLRKLVRLGCRAAAVCQKQDPQTPTTLVASIERQVDCADF